METEATMPAAAAPVTTAVRRKPSLTQPPTTRQIAGNAPESLIKTN